MVFQGLVIDLNNLLDGTWRVARTVLDENNIGPMQGSIAAQEIANQEIGASGPWGEEPVLTAYSLATVANFAAADHLGCLTTLISPDGIGGIFGPQVIARSCVEASARSWWLLDPAISVRDRVGRSFRVRLRSVDETKHLLTELIDGASYADDDGRREGLLLELDKQLGRRSEILADAVAKGVPVHRERGEPVGINVPMPKNDELVGALLRNSGATLGAAIYALLSGVSHATPYALLEYFEQVESADPLLANLEPHLRDESVLSMTTVVVLGFLESFGRLVYLYGWNAESWGSWAKHARRKIVEAHRRLEATRAQGN